MTDVSDGVDIPTPEPTGLAPLPEAGDKPVEALPQLYLEFESTQVIGNRPQFSTHTQFHTLTLPSDHTSVSSGRATA